MATKVKAGNAEVTVPLAQKRELVITRKSTKEVLVQIKDNGFLGGLISDQLILSSDTEVSNLLEALTAFIAKQKAEFAAIRTQMFYDELVKALMSQELNTKTEIQRDIKLRKLSRHVGNRRAGTIEVLASRAHRIGANAKNKKDASLYVALSSLGYNIVGLSKLCDRDSIYLKSKYKNKPELYVSIFAGCYTIVLF